MRMRPKEDEAVDEEQAVVSDPDYEVRWRSSFGLTCEVYYLGHKIGDKRFHGWWQYGRAASWARKTVREHKRAKAKLGELHRDVDLRSR